MYIAIKTPVQSYIDFFRMCFRKWISNLYINYYNHHKTIHYIYITCIAVKCIIKICSISKQKTLKNKNFKLAIKGELSLELLNSFVSLDVMRDGNSLKLINYQVIEKKIKIKG